MSDNLVIMQGPVCPVPLSHDQQIVMGHVNGGKISYDLIATAIDRELEVE
jgi:hypothetical protein